MRSPILFTGLLLATLPGVASIHPHHAPAKTHENLKHSTLKSNKQNRALAAAATPHVSVPAAHHEALAGIPSERATEIQSALIKQGYLTGEPSGQWDSPTVSAMQKLQGDNGWQTRITPDSRALIKLGLGPGSPTASPPPADIPQE